jgi:hypothetical protein
MVDKEETDIMVSAPKFTGEGVLQVWVDSHCIKCRVSKTGSNALITDIDPA